MINVFSPAYEVADSGHDGHKTDDDGCIPILHESDSKGAGMMDKILVIDDDQRILQLI